jgi:hypothetical protein
MKISIVLVWLSGFLVAIGLMIVDEVLTLARYCGPECVYPLPFNLLIISQYDAESLSWLLIIAGFSIMLGVAMRSQTMRNPPLPSSSQLAPQREHL